jgi:hypothetical protein
VQLPLEFVDQELLLIIAESLKRAFDDVRVASSATISNGSEAEVTALLEARLNSLIEENHFWGHLVLCVARGKESVSFDGTHLEKRPDLSIYLTNRHRSFPLIVEAKIIDSASAKGEVLYCENGVRRFVEGEYGWGVREAFMLGYVRDGSSIGTKLVPYLSPPAAAAKKFSTVAGLMSPKSGPRDCVLSKHGRHFVYIHQEPPGHEPGPIDLWHVWLA